MYSYQLVCDSYMYPKNKNNDYGYNFTGRFAPLGVCDLLYIGASIGPTNINQS